LRMAWVSYWPMRVSCEDVGGINREQEFPGQVQAPEMASITEWWADKVLDANKLRREWREEETK
jgi:hypothetical protein